MNVDNKLIIRPTVYDRPTVLSFDRPFLWHIDRPTDRPTFTRGVAVADLLTDANRYGRFCKGYMFSPLHRYYSSLPYYGDCLSVYWSMGLIV